jgi:hypothetical protein
LIEKFVEQMVLPQRPAEPEKVAVDFEEKTRERTVNAGQFVIVTPQLFRRRGKMNITEDGQSGSAGHAKKM